MTKDRTPATAFDASILDVLRTASRITAGNPRLVLRALRLLRYQVRAARRRALSETRGLRVPPFVIHSITDRCNLDCLGCYAKLLHRSDRDEMTTERVAELLKEARDLGVSIVLLAGGEPLIRPDVLDLTEGMPEILFLLFTNGSLLDDGAIARLRDQQHVIPVLSIEGDEGRTDLRRGEGTYAHVRRAMTRLKAARLFFGTSTTLTSENFDQATGEAFLEEMLAQGCRLFYLINYVPVQPGTEHLQLELPQVAELERRLTRYRRSYPSLFIAFPHDEVALGGCLAAGRGFLHINAYGDVEPCPFSPYSDANLNALSFEEALRSPLFAKILSSNVTLDETDGRCALFKRRKWVAELAAASESGRSDDQDSRQ